MKLHGATGPVALKEVTIMLKRHRLPLLALIAVVAIITAGLGSYALAQSGDGSPTAAPPENGDSRHVDYNVELKVAGDLSAVDPKLQGLLPLDLSASGGADVEKTENGPAVQGDLKLGGIDAVVQKLATGDGANTAQTAFGSSLVNSILSDIQFTAVDQNLYLKLGGAWYDAGSLAGRDCRRPEGDETSGAGSADKDKTRAALAAAFPGGPRELLKDEKTIGPEDIDGTATTHRSATIDLDKALTGASTAARNSGKAAEADKLDASRAQIISAVKQLNLDWWLDSNGELIQGKLALEIDPSVLSPLAEHLKGITSVSLNATVKFSNFGEDFQIARPDGDIKPLSDLTGMFGGRHGGDDDGNAGFHKNRGGTTTAAE